MLLLGNANKSLPAFKPDSLPEIISVVKEMEMISYPYADALSRMVEQRVFELKGIESEGLNKEIYKQVFAIASTKRTLFEISDEEGDDVRPSSKKLKMSKEAEQVTSMSILIDVAQLSFVRVESAPLAAEDEDLEGLDGLYDGLPEASLVPPSRVAVNEGVMGSDPKLPCGLLSFPYVYICVLFYFYFFCTRQVVCYFGNLTLDLNFQFVITHV
ncbi:hypothetical protein Hanom_Chr11g01042781 [Helianthus anomalus]